MQPKAGMADREITRAIARAMGFAMHYDHPSEIMAEIVRLTPTFAGITLAADRAEGGPRSCTANPE
jgi:formate dehydrogenase major subunit